MEQRGPHMIAMTVFTSAVSAHQNE